MTDCRGGQINADDKNLLRNNPDFCALLKRLIDNDVYSIVDENANFGYSQGGSVDDAVAYASLGIKRNGWRYNLKYDLEQLGIEENTGADSIARICVKSAAPCGDEVRQLIERCSPS